MRSLLLFLLFFPGFLSAQLNLQLIGHLPYQPLSLAGCWHHVDSLGNEYALVGTSAGLSIVDLNDPTHPVEKFVVNTQPNNWREIKTWGGFAYFGSEAGGSGITIVDLRSLPDTVYSKVWFGHPPYDNAINRSHTVQAEDGYLYIFGGGDLNNGATIANLNDPWNPQIEGFYTTNYVHDGFIRGDTLWTSEIYKGQFGVVDISNKSNPVLMATQPTPGAFNHNSGLSDDSRYLFTTDERPSTPLGSFDVSDLGNIRLLDTYFPSPNPAREVHNVRVKGNFLINPSYGGILTIVDATRPDNLIETAWTTMGNSLVWDADPYLPSGIVFATAKQEGLFIYQPVYQHAGWLEGKVADALTGQPILNARVEVTGTPELDSTDIAGQYKTGAASTAVYPVKVSASGYQALTQDVALQSGMVTNRDFLLQKTVDTPVLPDAVDLKVWPTVFDTEINLNWSNAQKSERLNIALYKSDGQLVAERTIFSGETTWNGLGNLAAGQYWLKAGARTVSMVKY